ncbi:MAG: hypothetical protein US74_C0002G0004 [Parcubacteria group bacterium GW2011_GWA2_38_13]|nr:MAG: hypothetical protein US74_C0002G0004 [Parcubacteria group bacterium GW2011_GWA2_38_13]
MAKKIFIYCILLSVFFSALSPLQVLAQPSPCAEMPKLQEKIKCSIDNMELALNDADKETYLGLVLKGLFSFLAVLFFLLIIYGGILWMTAAGSDQKIEKAKKIIISSTIGIVVVFTAYLITVLAITLLRPAP